MKLKLLKVFSEKNMFEWAKNDNEIFKKFGALFEQLEKNWLHLCTKSKQYFWNFVESITAAKN